MYRNCDKIVTNYCQNIKNLQLASDQKLKIILTKIITFIIKQLIITKPKGDDITIIKNFHLTKKTGGFNIQTPIMSFCNL